MHMAKCRGKKTFKNERTECPICGAHVVRLKRHLEGVHGEDSVKQWTKGNILGKYLTPEEGLLDAMPCLKYGSILASVECHLKPC